MRPSAAKLEYYISNQFGLGSSIYVSGRFSLWDSVRHVRSRASSSGTWLLSSPQHVYDTVHVLNSLSVCFVAAGVAPYLVRIAHHALALARSLLRRQNASEAALNVFSRWQLHCRHGLGGETGSGTPLERQTSEGRSTSQSELADRVSVCATSLGDPMDSRIDC